MPGTCSRSRRNDAGTAASEDFGVDAVGNALKAGDEVIDAGFRALAPFLARLVTDTDVKAGVVAHDRHVAPDDIVGTGGGKGLGGASRVAHGPGLGERGVGNGLEVPLPVEAGVQHGRDGLFQIGEPAGTVHFKRQHRVAAHIGGKGLRHKNQHCTQHQSRTEYQMHS